jgi:ketosteroid isomerase-like protein
LETTRRGALHLLSAALLAAPAMAISATALPPPGAGPARDRLAIQQAARDWISAFKGGDLDALMALYEPDAYVALHGQPALRGIEAVRAYFAPRVGRGQVEFLLDIERIDVRGRVAHLISAYWFTLELPGQLRYEDAGRSLLIYRRGSRGQWRIHIDIDQDTPDIGFPPPPSAR